MVERPMDLNFTAESLCRFVSCRRTGLDRYGSVVPRWACTVHRSGSSVPESFFNLVLSLKGATDAGVEG
jgi:hypothetical protein